MSLDIVPITLAEANAFVERYHRHHKAVVGHKFSIGATDGKKIVGVAIVGRPREGSGCFGEDNGRNAYDCR